MNREKILKERQRLKAEYKDLFEAVAALLFRHDPMSINFETNSDEYEPEVGTILPRLRACNSADDVTRIVHEEFIRWFSADSDPISKYEQIGKEIWLLWQRRNGVEGD